MEKESDPGLLESIKADRMALGYMALYTEALHQSHGEL